MAKTFNGSNQYMYIESTLVATEPFTMSAWFRPTALTGGYQPISIGTYTDTARSWRCLRIRGDLAGDPLSAQAYNAETNTSNGCVGNAWNHGIGIFVSDSERHAILNGGAKASNTDTKSLNNASNCVIGANRINSTAGEFFAGQLAEIAIWNVALTDAEAAMLASGVSPRMIRPQSLVGYWPILGETSPEIDVVGGYAMTPVNTPTDSELHPPMFYGAPVQALSLEAYSPPSSGGSQPRHSAVMLSGGAIIA